MNIFSTKPSHGRRSSNNNKNNGSEQKSGANFLDGIFKSQQTPEESYFAANMGCINDSTFSPSHVSRQMADNVRDIIDNSHFEESQSKFDGVYEYDADNRDHIYDENDAKVKEQATSGPATEAAGWLLPGERILLSVAKMGYLRTIVEMAESKQEAESAKNGTEHRDVPYDFEIESSSDDDDDYDYDLSSDSSDESDDDYDDDDDDNGDDDDSEEGNNDGDYHIVNMRDSVPKASKRHSRSKRSFLFGGFQSTFEQDLGEHDGFNALGSYNGIEAIDSQNRQKVKSFFKIKRVQKKDKKRQKSGSNLTVQLSDIHGNSRSILVNDAHGIEYRNVLSGTLFITNYQIRFTHFRKVDPATPRNQKDAVQETTHEEMDSNTPVYQPEFSEYVVSTPLTTILKIEERFPQSEPASSNSAYNGCTSSIRIHCKDFQIINLLFYNFTRAHSNDIFRQINTLFYPQTVDRFFSFVFGRQILARREPPSNTEQNDLPTESSMIPQVTRTINHACGSFTMEQIRQGWMVYDFIAEFQRQQVLDKSEMGQKWRISRVNEKFETCNTYPRLLIVPRTIYDIRLRKSSAFRSKGRIPVLTWQHPNQTSCIMRSSQPMVGISGSRCMRDEELMRRVLSVTRAKKLYFIDARPKANAMANTVMGKGYENTKHYVNSELEFLNIDNIHTMTRSLNSLRNLCQKPTDFYWLSNMERSGWLKHLKHLIAGANRIVEIMHKEKCPVLVHCSDGWDRTSQLCALAQLLLDPYYRTIQGFQVLIEKDWISFGFKFLERCGHITKGNSSEYSPIFMQWIDCVWHIWQQYPSAFEFNEVFLITLMDHVHNCLFGNFLHNSMRERELHDIKNTTVSLWTYINSDLDRYRNSFYRDPLMSTTSMDTESEPVATVDTSLSSSPHQVRVLVPETSTSILSTTFWVNYYFRYIIDFKSKGSLMRKLKRRKKKKKKSKHKQKQQYRHSKMERDLVVISKRMQDYERYFEQHGGLSDDFLKEQSLSIEDQQHNHDDDDHDDDHDHDDDDGDGSGDEKERPISLSKFVIEEYY